MATKAAVAEEKLKSNKTNEIMFGVGLGVGGAIIGLAPTFWSAQPQGWIALVIGFALMIGATVGRIVYK